MRAELCESEESCAPGLGRFGASGYNALNKCFGDSRMSLFATSCVSSQVIVKTLHLSSVIVVVIET